MVGKEAFNTLSMKCREFVRIGHLIHHVVLCTAMERDTVNHSLQKLKGVAKRGREN